MLGYEYVTLNDTQIATRRQQLDQAGWQAFAVPIVIVLSIWAFRSLNIPRDSMPKSSSEPSILQKSLRRFLWTINNTYIQEFGPLHIQLFGLAYAGLLVRRIFYQTENDYMHLTKAFGHVAVSQLPMHYLLAIKSPYSPITLATGLTHERLNAYHRLFGRIVHSLLAIHAIMYMRFFVAINVLSKRIKDNDVRLGLLAFWTTNILGILAIPPIRKRFYYKYFYRSHLILSAALLVVLWYHVPYTRIFVGQAGVFWFGNGLLRRKANQPATVACTFVNDETVRVKAKMTGSHHHPYFPGVHVYVNWHGLPIKTPFTVASARRSETGETEVDLIAKVSGGPMTSSFAKAATVEREIGLQLEGPYGEAQQYMTALMEQAKSTQMKFLLVAGGVGATYILPIYQSLQKARGSSKNIRVVWVVRKDSDLAWASSFLEMDKETSPEARAIILHITQPNGDSVPAHVKNEISKKGSHRPNFDQYVDDFVNERLKPSSKGGNMWEKNPAKADQKLHDPVTVMVCGPAGLTQAVRKAAGKHVHGYGRDVRWYEEQYGFGGS